MRELNQGGTEADAHADTGAGALRGPAPDPARPNIWVDEGFTLYRLTGGLTTLHATAVPHVMISASGPITVEAGAHRVTAQAVCVAPHVLHTVDGRGALFYALSLDRHRAPTAADTAPVRAVTGAGLRALIDYVDRLDGGDALELGARLLFSQMRLSAPVQEAARLMWAAPMRRLGQHEAARAVGLERSTLLKRFRRETGMTFRHYKSWVGLATAVRLVKDGHGIARAAMDAGFSDVAHFSRQCRALTGYSPRQGTQYMARAAEMARLARG